VVALFARFAALATLFRMEPIPLFRAAQSGTGPVELVGRPEAQLAEAQPPEMPMGVQFACE